MPRYDYKCKSCGRDFEVAHGINDNVETCEECGGEVRRVFHPIGVIFKGSGFYATDAKKPSNKPSGTPERDHKDEKAEDKPKPDGNGGKKKDEKKPEKSDSKSKS
jgi:putative FmdB family regulatory protein